MIAFESTAKLTPFDNAGHREVYRYDANAESLVCVSCGAGLGPATADASLQSTFQGNGDFLHPLSAVEAIPNLSKDGDTVLFESKQALLPDDFGAVNRVYRWHNGELARISGSDSDTDSFLYAANADASDVLFLTFDHLLPQDINQNGAIYDARVDGGFEPPESVVTEPCSGDACQGAPSATPAEPGIASSGINGQGNVTPGPRCPKGKQQVKRGGKVRCVKRKHKHRSKHKKRNHHRAGANRRAAR